MTLQELSQGVQLLQKYDTQFHDANEAIHEARLEFLRERGKQLARIDQTGEHNDTTRKVSKIVKRTS